MYYLRRNPDEFVRLRDEAFEEADPFHKRIEEDFANYMNREMVSDRSAWIRRFKSVVQKSYDPQIRKGVHRMIPLFTEQIQEISLKSVLEDEAQLIEDLRNWKVMMEDADGESERLQNLVTHNLTHGNSISKGVYDEMTGVVRSATIPPCDFAPDPAGTQSNFSDSDYVCHTTWHRRSKVHYDYEDWQPKRRRFFSLRENNPYDSIRIDELYVRKHRAAECGYEITDDTAEIIEVLIIDGETHSVEESDSFFPDFPFAFWRNFMDFNDMNKASDFWGIGYATLMESEQRLYDELLANFILIIRNLTVGKAITEFGVLDMESLDNHHGAIIELEEGAELGQIEHLPPADVPAVLFQTLTFVRGMLQENAPSLSDTFSGANLESGTSGRAISNVQNAAFNLFAENVRQMNEFRRRRAYIQLNLIQQYAEKPLSPHLWRGGLVMPDKFDRDARRAKFALSFPEVSGLPFTPAGKIQFLSALQGLGIRLKPHKILDMLKLESGYGITSEDYEVINQSLTPDASGAMPLDSLIIDGTDSSLPSEQNRTGA